MMAPLAGLRVVDLTHHVAGPYCTKLLAEYGAEVIKVERPGGGDPARRLGPFPGDVPHPEKSGLFAYLNGGKRSVTLNLKSEAGRQMLLELVHTADAVIENFAPRVLPGLGLGYEQLRAVRPNLVMASISNFGQSGPYRDWALTDLNALAYGGIMSITGDPDREPLMLPGRQAQYLAGLHAAVAVTGALYGTRLGLPGAYLDVAISEAVVSVIGETIVAYTYAGLVARRQGNRQMSAHPFTILPCRDGFVGVTVLTGQQWQAMAEMMGNPALLDERFATGPSRRRHADAVDALMSQWLMQHDAEAIFHSAQGRRIPFGKVSRPGDLPDDPQYQARGSFVRVEDPDLGPVRLFAGPVRIDGEPLPQRPAPRLGEDNAAVWGELGLGAGDLVPLWAQGII